MADRIRITSAVLTFIGIATLSVQAIADLTLEYGTPVSDIRNVQTASRNGANGLQMPANRPPAAAVGASLGN